MKSPYFLFKMKENIHQEVKMRAAMRNISMSYWINQAIMARIASERKYEEKKEKDNGK
jgi:hypothetical protein